MNPQGTLNADALKVLHAYGLDISNERNKKAAHTGGGHSFLRTCINLGIKNSLERMMDHILSQKQGYVHIVSLGDKFRKTQTQLNKMLEWSPSMFFQRPREGASAEDVRRYEA